MPRLDGDALADHRAHVLGPGAGGVDDVAGLDPVAAGRLDCSHLVAASLESRHLVGDEFDAHRADLVLAESRPRCSAGRIR